MKPTKINDDDHKKILEKFQSESDRGAAVLAGGLIESYMADFLESYMVKGRSKKNLFEGFGPFASYSQRVETAYAFGLIPEKMRTELKKIGKIRNEFAHHPLNASFDADPIKNLCESLWMKERLKEHCPDVIKTNREIYILAISDILAYMKYVMLKREGKWTDGTVPYIRIR